MEKINIKPKNFYLTTIVIFITIILLFSAMYPYSLDELRISHDNFADVFKQIKITFTTDAARFFSLPYIIFLRSYKYWKIVFSILNPFVQLFIVLSMFFIATGKKVNFNTTKDFYPFLLVVLLYLFLIPSPSNTLFWMAGVMNYSWALVPSLILLCLFRQTIDGKSFKNSALSNFLMSFCGFAAGMSNENTGPMILGLTVLFLIYCKYKKIKIPNFYYFAFAGIILGLTAMFGSGAGMHRLKSNRSYNSWIMSPLSLKIFLSLRYIHMLLIDTFCLPIINLIILLLVFYDKKLQMLKDKEFILSFLFYICSIVLAFVLFMTPEFSKRTYYSSAVFLFISFILTLLLIKRLYSINLIKYVSIALLIMAIIVSPLITIPHLFLYKQDKIRRQTISSAIKANKKEVFVNRLIVLKAPTDNWTIEYYDILWPKAEKKLNKKIKIKYPPYNGLSATTEPI